MTKKLGNSDQNLNNNNNNIKKEKENEYASDSSSAAESSKSMLVIMPAGSALDEWVKTYDRLADPTP